MTASEGLLCSRTHEWVKVCEDNTVIIGLTDYIVNQLGDIVSVELPEIGLVLSKDEVFATIESVRVARELYIPINAKVVEINENLINSPDLINENPFENWLIRAEALDYQVDSEDLLEYDEYIEELN